MAASDTTTVVFDDLPDDVVIEGILLHLDSKSVDSLGRTCRRLSVLTKDEAFWRKRIRVDFGLNFDLFDVDRVSFGFARNLWKGLKNPVSHLQVIKARTISHECFRAEGLCLGLDGEPSFWYPSV